MRETAARLSLWRVRVTTSVRAAACENLQRGRCALPAAVFASTKASACKRRRVHRAQPRPHVASPAAAKELVTGGNELYWNPPSATSSGASPARSAVRVAFQEDADIQGPALGLASSALQSENGEAAACATGPSDLSEAASAACQSFATAAIYPDNAADGNSKARYRNEQYIASIWRGEAL